MSASEIPATLLVGGRRVADLPVLLIAARNERIDAGTGLAPGDPDMGRSRVLVLGIVRRHLAIVALGAAGIDPAQPYRLLGAIDDRDLGLTLAVHRPQAGGGPASHFVGGRGVADGNENAGRAYRGAGDLCERVAHDHLAAPTLIAT
jgi:hypothetical protein